MIEQQKKLSRRDALKVLGVATGASVLTSLPSKWSKPELVSGVLPAHAQTSVCSGYAVFFEVLAGAPVVSAPFPGYPNPDEIIDINAGSPGTTVAWNCQSGCIGFRLHLATNNGTSGFVQVSTISQQFTLTLDLNKPDYAVLVNADTGEYALDGAGSAGACNWLLDG